MFTIDALQFNHNLSFPRHLWTILHGDCGFLLFMAFLSITLLVGCGFAFT